MINRIKSGNNPYIIIMKKKSIFCSFKIRQSNHMEEDNMKTKSTIRIDTQLVDYIISEKEDENESNISLIYGYLTMEPVLYISDGLITTHHHFMKPANVVVRIEGNEDPSERIFVTALLGNSMDNAYVASCFKCKNPEERIERYIDARKSIKNTPYYVHTMIQVFDEFDCLMHVTKRIIGESIKSNFIKTSIGEKLYSETEVEFPSIKCTYPEYIDDINTTGITILKTRYAHGIANSWRYKESESKSVEPTKK